MLNAIRQTFPATRTLSDARLTAIVAAVAVLGFALLDGFDAGGALVAGGLIVAGLAWRARTSAAPEALVLADAADDAHPVALPADALLARATALRDRSAARC